MTNQVIINAKNISKTFDSGKSKVSVLSDINLEICAGDEIAIMGASGSGKSTLMHILGGLDFSDTGNVSLFDNDFAKISEKKRCELRNKHLGFVYQFHHLLPEFTALENVAMPLSIRGVARDSAYEQATDILSKVGLSRRLDHNPAMLSGGERQRAAIARALITKPDCLLADEPTGNLDSVTAQGIRDLLSELNQTLNMGILIVTHDENIAATMQKQWYVKDGMLEI